MTFRVLLNITINAKIKRTGVIRGVNVVWCRVWIPTWGHVVLSHLASCFSVKCETGTYAGHFLLQLTRCDCSCAYPCLPFHLTHTSPAYMTFFLTARWHVWVFRQCHISQLGGWINSRIAQTDLEFIWRGRRDSVWLSLITLRKVYLHL